MRLFVIFYDRNPFKIKVFDFPVRGHLDMVFLNVLLKFIIDGNYRSFFNKQSFTLS